MSIKVKEVLELAQSKGCTLAAGEGGMDRIVRFVDCMEIPDMKAWMRPNVLYITTGYAYSDTKEEIMNLIRNLYEAKAAALATKYRYIGCFLDDAIKLANELQFPIILWPEDLPFIEMNYLVMEALIKSQNNLMDTIYSRIEKYNRREMDKRSKNKNGHHLRTRSFILKLMELNKNYMNYRKRLFMKKLRKSKI